jgi:hypothetical protein
VLKIYKHGVPHSLGETPSNREDFRATGLLLQSRFNVRNKCVFALFNLILCIEE